MTVQDKTEQGNLVFSPEKVSPDQLVISFLMHRISNLSKDALADLVSLGPELASCSSEQEYREIAETMREILFADEQIGAVREGPMSGGTTKGLEKRIRWVSGQIKKFRTEAKLTQEELAERSGLPQSHISRLESAQHSPSHRTLERIAEALGISVGDLDPAEE